MLTTATSIDNKSHQIPQKVENQSKDNLFGELIYQTAPDSDLALEVLELFGQKCESKTNHTAKYDILISKAKVSQSEHSDQSKLNLCNNNPIASSEKASDLKEIFKETNNPLSKLQIQQGVRIGVDGSGYISRNICAENKGNQFLNHQSSRECIVNKPLNSEDKICPISLKTSNFTVNSSKPNIEDKVDLRSSICLNYSNSSKESLHIKRNSTPELEYLSVDTVRSQNLINNKRRCGTDEDTDVISRKRPMHHITNSIPTKFGQESIKNSIRSMKADELSKTAIDLKHKADRMPNCKQKILRYLESVCYFAMQAEGMINMNLLKRESSSDAVLRDTIKLLRFTFSIFQSFRNQDPTDTLFLERFDYLQQLATSFIYFQRWKYSMNNVQQLSSTLMEICSQANANSNRSPTSSPGESITSSASGSISPSSSEFKMLCENLLHMVNKPVCASLNWKNAQQLLESSTHVKAMCEYIESRYKMVNYASLPIECFTYILLGIDYMKMDLQDYYPTTEDRKHSFS